ncbi:MAG: hypothetical protein HFE79_04585 [Ruminiclostridium sp.]|nr:hypothetical protein [Ruminiclostridium sp.]
MKEKLEKLKKPVCAVIMLICMFLLLGCTGTAELGGNINVYAIQGAVLLVITIISGIIGGLFS